MSTQEDISDTHWRTLATVVIVTAVTTGVLGMGVAIGYNLAVGS